MAGGKGDEDVKQGRETPCYGIRFAEHSRRSASVRGWHLKVLKNDTYHTVTLNDVKFLSRYEKTWKLKAHRIKQRYETRHERFYAAGAIERKKFHAHMYEFN